MIFSDMGVNPTQWGYSAYEEITRKAALLGGRASHCEDSPTE